MGMTYWLNVRTGEDDIESDESDLSMLCRHTEMLDVLCKRLGAVSISSFMDTTEMAREMDEDQEFSEEDEALYDQDKRPYRLDQMHWCDAADGLATFQKLREHFQNAPPEGLNDRHRQYLEEEIEEVLDTLEAAAKRGQRFHLELLS